VRHTTAVLVSPLLQAFVTQVLAENLVMATAGDDSVISTHCTRGVVQGCPLSSTLFSMVLARITTEVVTRLGGEVLRPDCPVAKDLVLCSYADDIFILARSERGAAELLNTLAPALQDVGLTLAPHKTRLIADAPWTLLGRRVEPQPALEVLGIPLGDQPAATTLLLEKIQEVTAFVQVVREKVHLQAHRLLMLRESGPFARLQWVMAGVAPPVATDEVMGAARTLDRLVTLTILSPPPGVEAALHPSFLPLDQVPLRQVDLAAARLGYFIPLLRHLQPRPPTDPRYDRRWALVYQYELRGTDDSELPPFYSKQAKALKPLLSREALMAPDPALPATLFAVSGLPGALPRERVYCANEGHAAGSEPLHPNHHLVCRCAATIRHNRVRDLDAPGSRRPGAGTVVWRLGGLVPRSSRPASARTSSARHASARHASARHASARTSSGGLPADDDDDDAASRPSLDDHGGGMPC